MPDPTPAALEHLVATCDDLARARATVLGALDRDEITSVQARCLLTKIHERAKTEGKGDAWEQ